MKIVRCRMVILIVVASFSLISVAAGSDLDQDCKPRGWVQMFSAWWNPVGFWSAQPSAIQQEVESHVKTYQVYLVQRQANITIATIEREKARIEQATLEEQLQILGVKSKPISPEVSRKLDQVLAKADESIETTRAYLAANAIRWGERCMAFSREQLAKATR